MELRWYFVQMCGVLALIWGQENADLICHDINFKCAVEANAGKCLKNDTLRLTSCCRSCKEFEKHGTCIVSQVFNRLKCGSGYRIKNKTICDDASVCSITIESCYISCQGQVNKLHLATVQKVQITSEASKELAIIGNFKRFKTIEEDPNGYLSLNDTQVQFNQDVVIQRINYRYWDKLKKKNVSLYTTNFAVKSATKGGSFNFTIPPHANGVKIDAIKLYSAPIWSPWSHWEPRDEGLLYERTRQCYKEKSRKTNLEAEYCDGISTQYTSEDICQIKVNVSKTSKNKFHFAKGHLRGFVHGLLYFHGRRTSTGIAGYLTAWESGGGRFNAHKVTWTDGEYIVLTDPAFCPKPSWQKNELLWSKCKPIEKDADCGNGTTSFTPTTCLNKNGTSVAHKRCGQLPVHMKSCRVVCQELCNDESSVKNYSSVVWEWNSQTIKAVQIHNENMILKQMTILICMIPENLMAGSLSNQYPLVVRTFSESVPVKTMTTDSEDCFAIPTNTSLKYVRNGALNIRHRLSGVLSPLIRKAVFKIEDIKGCEVPTFSKWVPGACSLTCGNGTKEMRQVCALKDGREFDDTRCTGEKEQNRFEPCVSICFTFSSWSDWEACEGSCGPHGVQNRTKDCLGDNLLWNNTVNCTSVMPDETYFEDRHCSMIHYPCYNFSQWAEWKPDSNPCETYNSTRMRYCYKNYVIEDRVNETRCMSRFNTTLGNIDKKTTDTTIPCFVWKNWTMWQREDVACENGTNVFRRPCLNFIHETANISNCIKRGADPQPPDRWCNEYEGCVYQYKNVTNVTGILCIGYSLWNQWTSCSKECGFGIQNRTRKCIFKDKEICEGFTDTFESDLCNKFPCKVNGKWSPWSSWTHCSTSCGPGQQHRVRSCIPPMFNGSDCERDDGGYSRNGTGDEQPCFLKPCKGLKLAKEGEACDTACKGMQLVCKSNMTHYNDKQEEMLKLTQNECDIKTEERASYTHEYDPSYHSTSGVCQGYVLSDSINCSISAPAGTLRFCYCGEIGEAEYGDWGLWSPCSLSCGAGIQNRLRANLLDFELKDEDAAYLEEITSDTRSCGEPCHNPGNWGEWSAYSKCSVTCEFGVRKKFRFCDSPPPTKKEDACPGLGVAVEPCTGASAVCPVNGGWSAWSEWSPCDKPCMGGVRKRRRTCTNPRPELGGSPCPTDPIGKLQEEKCDVNRPCTHAQVKLELDFTNVEFDESMSDLDSTIAKNFKERLTGELRKMYKDHAHFKKFSNDVTVELHELRRGKGRIQ